MSRRWSSIKSAVVIRDDSDTSCYTDRRTNEGREGRLLFPLRTCPVCLKKALHFKNKKTLGLSFVSLLLLLLLLFDHRWPRSQTGRKKKGERDNNNNSKRYTVKKGYSNRRAEPTFSTCAVVIRWRTTTTKKHNAPCLFLFSFLVEEGQKKLR